MDTVARDGPRVFIFLCQPSFTEPDVHPAFPQTGLPTEIEVSCPHVRQTIFGRIPPKKIQYRLLTTTLLRSNYR
jgi:hypothetical protein